MIPWNPVHVRLSKLRFRCCVPNEAPKTGAKIQEALPKYLAAPIKIKHGYVFGRITVTRLTNRASSGSFL
jgi:hypothetical protein